MQQFDIKHVPSKGKGRLETPATKASRLCTASCFMCKQPHGDASGEGIYKAPQPTYALGIGLCTTHCTAQQLQPTPRRLTFF